MTTPTAPRTYRYCEEPGGCPLMEHIREWGLDWHLASEEDAYSAHLARLDEDEQRAASRRGKPTPHAWGDPMPGGYFCVPCWQRGDPTGSHPYSEPPCDPVPAARW